jgi:hypothetical protein
LHFDWAFVLTCTAPTSLREISAVSLGPEIGLVRFFTVAAYIPVHNTPASADELDYRTGLNAGSSPNWKFCPTCTYDNNAFAWNVSIVPVSLIPELQRSLRRSAT